jgi:hypothetical protein
MRGAFMIYKCNHIAFTFVNTFRRVPAGKIPIEKHPGPFRLSEMESEHLDFDALMTERRAAAASSMAPITHDTLDALGEKLFTTLDHPWQAVYVEFLAGHRDSPAVHGTVPDGVEFVFFPREGKGLWFRRAGAVTGMGPIQPRGIAALQEIAAEKGLG